jgi:hypothetical protein
VDDGEEDDELQAASAAAASTAAPSATKRLGVLIMSMSLLARKASECRGHHPADPVLSTTTYQERLRVSGAEIQANAVVVARL